LLCVCLNAQNPNLKKGEIGLTFTPIGTYTLVTFSKGNYAEDKYKYLYSFGINYIFPLNNRLELETGIEFSKYNKKNYYPSHIPDGIYIYGGDDNLSFINIPINLRINFLKFFFFNTGTLIDLDFAKNNDIDNQTGLGLILGLGAKYDFKSGISVFANPFVRCHSVISFASDKYHERLIDAGVRFGITYNLK